MKNEENRLTLKQMQEMFCDYAFNRLQDAERKIFEENIDDYPEIQKELKEVNLVFSKVERMDFDKRNRQFTRNLSVKVNKRLAVETKSQKRSRYLMKYIIPTAGLAAIVAIFFFGDLSLFENNLNQQTQIVEISSADISSILPAELEENNIIKLASEIQEDIPSEDIETIAYLDETIIDETYDEYMEDFIANDEIVETGVLTENDLLAQLDYLNEEEFQTILEELENVKINP